MAAGTCKETDVSVRHDYYLYEEEYDRQKKE